MKWTTSVAKLEPRSPKKLYCNILDIDIPP
jgi:hypothetical protein